jgi:hypothetical protein
MEHSATREAAETMQSHLDDLTPELWAALAALAAVETRYRTKCEALSQVLGSDALKERYFDQLEARHMREREPLVQRLVELHYSLTVGAIVRDLGPGPMH